MRKDLNVLTKVSFRVLVVTLSAAILLSTVDGLSTSPANESPGALSDIPDGGYRFSASDGSMRIYGCGQEYRNGTYASRNVTINISPVGQADNTEISASFKHGGTSVIIQFTGKRPAGSSVRFGGRGMVMDWDSNATFKAGMEYTKNSRLISLEMEFSGTGEQGCTFSGSFKVSGKGF
jgi:hypothetical protein